MPVEISVTDTSEPEESLSSQVIEYPNLLKRVQSTFVDSLVAFFLTGLLVVAASYVNDNNTALKIMAIILGISYEPLMNTFGQTLGQLLLRIKVVDFKSGKRLNLLSAYMRVFFKTILGWLSFLIMFSNTQRRAMHDFIAGSVVVNK